MAAATAYSASVDQSTVEPSPAISRRIPRTAAIIQQGIAEGLHLGAQIYVSLHGQIVVDAAFGQSQPGVAMTPDTLMLWLSSGKPVTAAAIGQMWERDRLELDDAVIRHVPEFAAGGKERITIRHLLTHTGGFRSVAPDLAVASWEQAIAQICAAPLEPGWTPGEKAGYHATGSWFILGEIVRRLDGRPFEQYVRQEIFLPLGMQDTWMGMPPQRYQEYGRRISLIYDTSEPAPRMDPAANSPAGCMLCHPGGGTRGPIRELGYFYEAILGRGQRRGQRILSPQTVEALTACHRRGLFDQTFGRVMDWGLGFMVNSQIQDGSPVPYSFGRYASRRTIGHGGRQSSVGGADPDHDLAAAIAFNGCPGEVRHAARMRPALTALYEDLGLAGAA
jgi:CubicO group peptidase (beta-lactamase class C family)